MLRKVVAGVLAAGIAALAAATYAQDNRPPENRPLKALGDRIKSIFGDDLPDDQPAQRQYAQPTQPRAGGVRPTPGQRPPVVDMPADPPADPPSASPSQAPASPQYGQPTPSPRRVENGGWSQPLDESVTTPAAPALTVSDGNKARGTETADSSGQTLPPLHERLKRFRGSAFTESATNSATTSNGTAAGPPATESPTISQPNRSITRPWAGATAEQPKQVPTLAPPRPAADSPVVNQVPRTEPTPVLVEPSNSAADDARPAEPKWSPGPKARAEAKAESDVLFARKSPILSVESLGPRRITVGKEAAYEITLQNAGEVAADDVTVFVTLPDWTEVAGAEASTGNTRAVPQGTSEPYQWIVGRIEAKAREKLSLRIIPRQSKPFELAVRWECKPALSQATIEVQEPKLAMRLDGPREVFFGKREVYKLRLANTGTGAAENVGLSLTAQGTGDNQPVSHRLGTLPAGEERVIEIELTARQAGNLGIQVEAKADGNIRADLAEKVFVRRAVLEIDMEGPGVQYVGTAASYRVRLRNPGNAPAKNIQVTIALPGGAKFVSGTDGAKLAANGTRVQWTVDGLESSGERTLTLKCNLAQCGNSKVELSASGEDELAATAEAVTRVEALADLRLDVKDPEGPVPLGEEASYELHVRNRGTKTAENVEVLAYFSNGVEPTGAEGQPHRMTPGQVTFTPIPSLAPGAEVTLKVKARADAAGNHIFRAEVHCRPLGARLVREETTHFYQDGTQTASRTPVPLSSATQPGEMTPLRSADQRALPVPEQNTPAALPRLQGEPAPLMR